MLRDLAQNSNGNIGNQRRLDRFNIVLAVEPVQYELLSNQFARIHEIKNRLLSIAREKTDFGESAQQYVSYWGFHRRQANGRLVGANATSRT